MRLLEVDSNEVKNISSENIEEILKSEDKDKRKKVETYFKDKYGDLVTDVLMYLTDLALEQETLNHPVFEYVDKLNKNKSTNHLYLDYLSLLGNELDKRNINPNENWLYDKTLYNESSIAKNVYKIKAMLFLKNKRNIRDYGLFRKDNKGNFLNSPLTVEDIRGMDADKVRDFLNDHQSKKSGEGDSNITFRDWFKYQGIDTELGVLNYVRDKLKGNKSSAATRFRRALATMLDDAKGRAQFNNIMRLEVDSGVPGEVIKQFLRGVDEWIKSERYRGAYGRKRTPKSNQEGTRITAAQPFENDNVTRV